MLCVFKLIEMVWNEICFVIRKLDEWFGGWIFKSGDDDVFFDGVNCLRWGWIS